jgi:hypothetical protein
VGYELEIGGGRELEDIRVGFLYKGIIDITGFIEVLIC